MRWMALAGVVFALGAGSALAQVTITGPSNNTVNEGGIATYTVAVKGYAAASAVADDVEVSLTLPTPDITDATTAGELADLSGNNDYDLVFTVPVNASATAAKPFAMSKTIRVATVHDRDAEDEKFTLAFTLDEDGGLETTAVGGVNIGLAATNPTMLTIKDDETQAYVLALSPASQKPMEGTPVTVSLTVAPAFEDGSEMLSLVSDKDDVTGWSVNASVDTLDVDSPMAAITITSPTNDMNRAPDTITLSAHSGVPGNSNLEDSLTITLADGNALPMVTAKVVDKDGKVLDPQPTSVEEGKSVKIAVMPLDKDGEVTTANEDLEITLIPTGTADVRDYLPLAKIMITSGQNSSNAVDLLAEEDEDVGMEMLMFDATVSGEKDNGTETMMSMGVLSLYIDDATDKKIWPKAEDEAYPKIMAAMADGAGDDGLNPGESFMVMTDDLFGVMTGYTGSYATSVDGGAVSASTSGDSVTITANSAGEADVTVTGTAKMASSSFMPEQTVSNVASITFPVMVSDTPLMVTVTADPMEIDEGGMSTITATASRAVTAGDDEVMIDLDVVGDGMLDMDSIMIAAGAMSGSAMLTATEDDDDYMDETVTVVASGSGIEGTVQVAIMVTDNDEAPVDEPTVSAKSQEQVDAVFATAIVTAAGGPDWVEGGNAAMVDMSKLFNMMEGASPSYSGMSSAEMTVSAASSGMMLTLTPMADGMATITVTATDSVSGDIATAMSDVTVADLPLSVSLSAPAMVAEGGSIMLTATANKMVDADTMVTLARDGASTADMDDYTIEPEMITIAAGEMTGTTMLMATDDYDVEGNESLTLTGWLGDAVAGMVMVTIEDNDAETTYTLSASAEMVMEGDEVTITATASQMVRANTEVMVMRDAGSTAGADDYSVSPPLITIMMGETSATLTLTATDDYDVEGDESLTLNGMVGDMAAGSVMLTVTDNDAETTYTLSGPADPNVAEGMSADLTVTASQAVRMDTEVMIMRDGASTASAADFEVASAMIMAGEMTATTMVMAVEDNMAEEMEMLTLYGMVGDMSTNSVTLNLWDAAVPALPLIAQLLLAAFLAIGGYRRYLRR